MEIVEIAKECPENLQAICFEILLKHHLGDAVKLQGPTPATIKDEKPGIPQPTSNVEETTESQDDLTDADLHIKVRRFLDKSSLAVDNLNQLFYKENDEVIPLYDDLHTTKASESQIRITLLQCLHSAVKSGDFVTNVGDARGEAKTRKCYDENNWAANYTNNADLFDFEKYSKKLKDIRLSEKGKSELASLIKEMQ